MKLTLMIEASAAVLATILADLPDGASVTVAGDPSPLPPPVIPAPPQSAPPLMPLPAPGPVVPPVVAAPPMPPAPPAEDDGAPNPAPPMVDSAGLPWDERIHAQTRGLNADNSWRRRRGVDDATFDAVTAELKARGVSPPPVAPLPLNPTPPVMMTPPMPANPEPAGVPMVSPEPVVTTVTDPSPAALQSVDFSQFMQHISGQMAKPGADGQPMVHAAYLATLTIEISNAFVTAGIIVAPLQSITDIANNSQMIDYAMKAMQRDGRW